jgi:hypothetical protein
VRLAQADGRWPRGPPVQPGLRPPRNGKTKKGRFRLKRITDSKRLRAKLRSVKAELMRRRHQPIPEQGRWLASVLRGHANYYGVPGNQQALHAFRLFGTEH